MQSIEAIGGVTETTGIRPHPDQFDIGDEFNATTNGNFVENAEQFQHDQEVKLNYQHN